MKIKARKIKYRSPKFFGWSDEKWARGGGRNGYKRNYGHFCSYSGTMRTKAEKLDRAEQLDIQQVIKDYDVY